MNRSDQPRSVVQITTSIDAASSVQSIIEEVMSHCSLLEKIGHLPTGTAEAMQIKKHEIETSVHRMLNNPFVLQDDDEDEDFDDDDDDVDDDDFEDDDFEDDDMDIEDFDIADDDEWWEDDDELDEDDDGDEEEDFEDLLSDVPMRWLEDLTPTAVQKN